MIDLKAPITIMHNASTGKKYTLLTPAILQELGFKDNGKCTFPTFENLNYWVKNGVCLFYNTPVKEDYQEHFLIGYVDQRQGEYKAVTFRWIDSLEDLVDIYEAITNKKIEKLDT